MTKEPVDQIASLFAGAEVSGYLHAVDVSSGSSVALASDAPVVLASVFKIGVLVELFRRADAGEIDLSEPVVVPVDRRTEGPFGLSVMHDPVTMSWRDLAWLMMSVSDNAATDIICDRLRIECVNAAMQDLGLTDTSLVGNCRDLFDTILADLAATGVSSVDDVDLSDPSAVARLRAVDPLATSRSTPRDITALLAGIWSDAALLDHGFDADDVAKILGGNVLRLFRAELGRTST